MGVRVYGAGGRDGDDGGWATLAGCDGVRAQLEESLVLPLQNPEVYREVMEGTRAKRRAPHPFAKSDRPRMQMWTSATTPTHTLKSANRPSAVVAAKHEGVARPHAK